jgi:hypothetical protein
MEYYASVFASFPDKESKNNWLIEHGIKQSIPPGGPVFSYSNENESVFRDAVEILLEALTNIANFTVGEGEPSYQMAEIANKAIAEAGIK